MINYLQTKHKNKNLQGHGLKFASLIIKGAVYMCKLLGKLGLAITGKTFFFVLTLLIALGRFFTKIIKDTGWGLFKGFKLLKAATKSASELIIETIIKTASAVPMVMSEAVKLITGLVLILVNFVSDSNKIDLTPVIEKFKLIWNITSTWGTGILYNMRALGLRGAVSSLELSAIAVNATYSCLRRISMRITIPENPIRLKELIKTDSEIPTVNLLGLVTQEQGSEESEESDELIQLDSISQAKCPIEYPYYCKPDSLFREGRGNVSPCVKMRSDCNKSYEALQLAPLEQWNTPWSAKCTSKKLTTGDKCTDDEDMLYCPSSHDTFCPSDSTFRNNRRTNGRSRGNTAPCVSNPEHCDQPYEIVNNKTKYGAISKKCKSGLPEEERGNQCHRD